MKISVQIEHLFNTFKLLTVVDRCDKQLQSNYMRHVPNKRSNRPNSNETTGQTHFIDIIN